MTLGKDQAINLGVNYDVSIRRLLLGVTLYIAVATAMVGPLAFLGLIIANLSRQLLQTYRHTQLISGSVLFGMVILIGGQLIVEKYLYMRFPSVCLLRYLAEFIFCIYCLEGELDEGTGIKNYGKSTVVDNVSFEIHKRYGLHHL